MLKNILMKKLHGRAFIKSVLFIVFCIFNCVYAQTNAAILNPNDAVVTGFSQTVNQVDPKSEHFINLDGPSVRIFNLPNSGPFGLVEGQLHFTVMAKDVGQVFGVTLDNAATPNIYVAATSAYGLAIFKSGNGRVQQGKPGVQFVPGLFGPVDQGGGATSIWRIDGTTGKVSLFANVIYNGIENTPASLGGLAFDAATQQLFVADRTTGMIHRFSLDGTDHGVYDHGVEGLSAAGQETVPFDPANLVNIKSPQFNAKDPHTWGFAPIERRVFALAVYENRLFYSVSGSQIWSVGIATDGSFANDPRLEIDSPTLQKNIEISAIAFDNRGYMFIAERGFPTGEFNFINVSEYGKTRVIRFAPKKSENSSSGSWDLPGEEYAIGMLPDYLNANGGVDLTCDKTIWSTGDSLIASGVSSVSGLQGNAVNLVKPANVPPEKSWFVNYYDTNVESESHGYLGSVKIWKVCEKGYSSSTIPPVPSLPSASIPPPSIGSYCPPGMILMNGTCQFSPVCPDCCFTSCFWGGDCFWGPGWGGPWWLWGLDPWDLGPGWLGPWGWGPWDLGLWGVGPWGLGPWGLGPWGIDLWIIGPWWMDPCWMCMPFWNFCGFPPVCLFDEHFFDGPCLLPLSWCPGILLDGHCFSSIWPIAIIDEFLKKTAPITTCKSNERLVKGKCVPTVTCQSDERMVHGKCVPTTCGPSERLVNGKCVPPITCKSGERLVHGKCVPAISCKPSEHLVNGKCVPTISCKSNERLIDGECVPTITCKSYERLVNGKCIPTITCKPGERLVKGKCVPTITCKSYERLVNGKCVPIITCKPYERLINGKCVPIITCKSNERLINGKCVPIITCKPDERLVHGRCVPIITCRPYERLINGKCIPIVICKPGERLIKGKCVPTIVCKPGERLIKGKCVPTTITCRPYERLVNGKCVPVVTCKPGERLVHGKCVQVKTCKPGEVLLNGYCVPKQQFPNSQTQRLY